MGRATLSAGTGYPTRYFEKPALEKLYPDGAFSPEVFDAMLRDAGARTGDCFYAAVCIGIRPDYAKEIRGANYTEWSILNLDLYNDVVNAFVGRALGIEITRNLAYICLLCVFPEEHREDYDEYYLRPELDRLQKRFEVPILIGAGNPTDDPAQSREAVRSAEYAFGLYFFKQLPIIDLRREPGDEREMVEDEYKSSLETAIRAVLIKDSRALDLIDDVVKVISRFHYGNRAGVQVFTMEFAGDIAFRLRLMRLMGEDFFRMQDELQSGVVQAETLPELAGIVREYYGRVLRHYYKNDRPRGRLVIEEIKDYIRSHYMDEISLKQLANLAFVSPDHFSHLFKHETGENYKTFLTTVRMEHAEELLRHTDYRITEVAEKIGYRSTRAFVDAFRQRYSIGPTEYRRQKQRDDI